MSCGCCRGNKETKWILDLTRVWAGLEGPWVEMESFWRAVKHNSENILAWRLYSSQFIVYYVKCVCMLM